MARAHCPEREPSCAEVSLWLLPPVLSNGPLMAAARGLIVSVVPVCRQDQCTNPYPPARLPIYSSVHGLPTDRSTDPSTYPPFPPSMCKGRYIDIYFKEPDE